VPDSRIGSESSVIDEFQDLASTSAKVGTTSPYVVKLFSDCSGVFINFSL